MSHFLYILYSNLANKFYIGETSDVSFRLNLHNTHEFKDSFTKIASDWEIKLIFENEKKVTFFILKNLSKK